MDTPTVPFVDMDRQGQNHKKKQAMHQISPQQSKLFYQFPCLQDTDYGWTNGQTKKVITIGISMPYFPTSESDKAEQVVVTLPIKQQKWQTLQKALS